MKVVAVKVRNKPLKTVKTTNQFSTRLWGLHPHAEEPVAALLTR
jgi:hypothetical protein